MVAERGHLVPAPSAMARGSPGSLNFGGRGLCDLETADSTVSKGRPSAPGLIRPAGRPEKNHRTHSSKWQSTRRVDNDVGAVGGCGFKSRCVRHPAIEKPNAVERPNGRRSGSSTLPTRQWRLVT